MIVLQVTDVIRKRRFYTEVADKVHPEVGQFLLLKKEKDTMVVEVMRVLTGEKFQTMEAGVRFQQKLESEDMETFWKLQEGEADRLKKARELAQKFEMEMYFFAAKVGFDGNQNTFFFTAEKPVDFREMLKEMIKHFKGRIQLERVRARDRVTMLEGSEMCGAFSYPFVRVSEKIPLDTVRDQGIVIKNNQKIFDASGKIKPSMMYEIDAYRKNRKYLPHMQQVVKVSEEGKTGKVIGLDILNHRVKVLFEEAGVADFYHLNDIDFENKKPLPEELTKPVAEIDIEARLAELEAVENA